MSFIKTPSARPFVGLIKTPQGVLTYITMPHGISIGSFLYSGIAKGLTSLKGTGVFT